MRPGWTFEYHNLYLDLYNVFDPVLSDGARSRHVGRFNLRLGRFYTPFGLNLQTDTHGTVLQLSNEENFGFERDWYGGLWGTLNRKLNYDLYYMAGSGYGLAFKGQGGLGVARVSLGNEVSSRYGVEGGVSVMAGGRLVEGRKVDTRRVGVDGRYRHGAPRGLVTFTSEWSGGTDERRRVWMGLGEAEYLRASRRWGVAVQTRGGAGLAVVAGDAMGMPERRDRASVAGEFTWYFRNDVGNSNMHWIKVHVERRFENAALRPHTVVTLQYYVYR
jgi:hypothetical protein